MTNSALNPNSFLKAHFTDTFLCNGSARFDDVNNGQSIVSGLFSKLDTDFENPTELVIPNFIKRANLRVFNPEFVPYPDKFIAGYNLTGTIYGSGSLNPRLLLLDGSEIEVYGVAEIRKIILFPNIPAQNPFLLSIAFFK